MSSRYRSAKCAQLSGSSSNASPVRSAQPERSVERGSEAPVPASRLTGCGSRSASSWGSSIRPSRTGTRVRAHSSVSSVLRPTGYTGYWKPRRVCARPMRYAPLVLLAPRIGGAKPLLGDVFWHLRLKKFLGPTCRFSSPPDRNFECVATAALHRALEGGPGTCGAGRPTQGVGPPRSSAGKLLSTPGSCSSRDSCCAGFALA